FFSSRRRHTISKRDWSSDVCSSDLEQLRGPLRERQRLERIDHLARRAGGQIVRGQQLLRSGGAAGAAGEDQRGRGEGGEQGATRQGGGHEDPSGRRQGHADRTPTGYTSPGTGVPPSPPSARARARRRASSSRANPPSRDTAVAPVASTSP